MKSKETEKVKIKEALSDAAAPFKISVEELSSVLLRINQLNEWDVTTPEDWPETGLELEGANKLAAKLALVHSELSEALEAIRHGDRANFEEELADVVIRVLDIGEGLDLDVAGQIIRKLEKNLNRGVRHGEKAI